MKITLEQTTKNVVVSLSDPTGLPTRMWQGLTDDGIPVACLVVMVVPLMKADDPRHPKFENGLHETVPPLEGVDTFPGGLVL